MSVRIDRWVICGLVAAGTAGCVVGPNFAPEASRPLDSFESVPRAAAAGQAPPSQIIDASADPEWWHVFHDPRLDRLIVQAGDANYDLRSAAARLREARAQLGATSADRLPVLNTNASYTREKLSDKGVISLIPSSGGNTDANGLGGTAGALPTPAAIPPFNLWQQGFDASWELDLFGRVHREVESARASLAASVETRRDTQVSVFAEVARDYLQLRGAQAELEAVRHSLEDARQEVDLTRQRQAGGLASDLDVASSESLVATTEATVPPLEQQISQYEGAIAFLVGQPRSAVLDLDQPAAVPPLPHTVPVGLPSELARRRPDIREAEAMLHRATADIGVAEADFYPRITLSGSAGVQALQLKNFGSWSGALDYSAGPGITLPIFQGGRLRATLELRRAAQQEAAITYERTVRQAFREVDDALVAYGAEQRRAAALRTAVDVSRRAASLARDQYVSGLGDYLRVLDAERVALTAEQQLAVSEATEATDLVQLYKALGGGWQNEQG